MPGVFAFSSGEPSIAAWPRSRLLFEDQRTSCATPAAKSRELDGFGVQETSNGAWVTPVVSYESRESMGALANRFCGRAAGGVEWVEMISALASAAGPQDLTAKALEVEFACRFFWPVVLCVSDLSTPDKTHVNAHRVPLSGDRHAGSGTPWPNPHALGSVASFAMRDFADGVGGGSTQGGAEVARWAHRGWNDRAVCGVRGRLCPLARRDRASGGESLLGTSTWTACTTWREY